MKYYYKANQTKHNLLDPGALQNQIQLSTIITAIDGVVGINGDYTVTFKQELSAEDKLILDSIVAEHDGKPIEYINKVELHESHDAAGRLMVVPEKRIGAALDVSTHNFCDKTTWCYGSKRVYDEKPSIIDSKSVQLKNNYIIDVVHGKLSKEDSMLSSYKVIVTCDGTDVCEYTPFESDYEDCIYTVDYENGVITFDEDITDKEILVTYSYAVSSEWRLIPQEGKKIVIEKSEVQFSDNIAYTDAIDFEIWAYDANDLPNKKIINRNSYKSVHNFVDEASGAYPIIPPVGDKKQPTIGFPFNYNTVTEINSKFGVELIIKTRNNRVLGGERSTATFYCTIHDA